MNKRDSGTATGHGKAQATETRPTSPPTPQREEDAVVSSRAAAIPPPDTAEALYYEGMAAYQHRNWEEALERFNRLKAFQPHRPGLDALLDEVRWFQQLQAAVPAALPAGDRGSEGGAIPQKPQDEKIRPRPGWQTWGLVLLGCVGIAALLLIALQGNPLWANASERAVQELTNQGQARLAVGDYEGARAAFEKLLEIVPNDPEALLGLEHARRQQTLAEGYAAAAAAIAAEDWDTAIADLEEILAIDGNYADARAQADFAAQRKRLATLYAEASRLVDLARWEDAIVQLETIRDLDDSYRKDAVGESLFICYLNAGRALVENSHGETAPVQRAIEYFSNALAIHPENRGAADARRLASLYLDTLRVKAEGSPDAVATRLEVLLAAAPDYAGGAAAQELYELDLRLAEAAVKSGDISEAIKIYQRAQTLVVADRSVAITGEADARAITPTPRPGATVTPEPTAAPAMPASSAVVRTETLNVRAGPGTGYPVLEQVGASEPLTILGRNAKGSWLEVCCVAGKPGWVAARWVEIEGPSDVIPVMTPPAPPPGPAATPTPIITQITCIAGQVRNTGGGGPLAGWTIVLQAPDGATRTRRADGSGTYRFADLPAGAYTIREQVAAGWRAVSPQSSPIIVAPARACTLVDFWNENVAVGPGPTQPTVKPASPTPAR